MYTPLAIVEKCEKHLQAISSKYRTNCCTRSRKKLFVYGAGIETRNT